MLKKRSSFNNAAITQSNNNVIVQGSVINNLIIDNNASTIQFLGETKQFDSIQKYIVDILSAAKQTHPLYPNFSAKFDSDMNKLISSPETEDAFKKYPKKIKGTMQIDYKKYPHMDKSETPWEYAYRTQAAVKLETTEYQEYLGDYKDPFPLIKHTDGMVTVINPPEFPPEVEAVIISGKISIPIHLRRKPYMEYGKLMFGTVSTEQGFDFNIITDTTLRNTDFTITKVNPCPLDIQLQREKLFIEISKTKHLSITIDGKTLVDAYFNSSQLENDMLKAAPYLVNYLESLLIIEEYTSCKFSLKLDDYDNYHTALLLASSLQNKWLSIKTDFDDKVRCDYNTIADNINQETPLPSEITLYGKSNTISLQGQQFKADKYIIIYRDARINNIASVIKHKKRKKKNIQITFRPNHGKEFFYKLCKLEGIHLI